MTGKTSRSLKAAFIALNFGILSDVAHLDGGVYAWCVTFPLIGCATRTQELCLITSAGLD
jgi:hypothetical protein